jgi:DNA-directed RNA polymerase specialized sigma24 family protein
MTSSNPSNPLSLASMDASTARTHFRPLLLRITARLAAQGWFTRPEDGLDVIDDFFETQWTGLSQRYVESKAPAHSYVGRAYSYYARRRFAETRRWTNTLRDSATLASLVDSTSAQEQFAESDRQAVADALTKLSPQAREALLAYLAASGKHERDVARRLRITRHRLRSLVSDAFGRVAVAIGAAGEFSAQDREIALLLWRDGLSVSQIAGRFNLPAKEVQETRARFLERLKRGLR